MPGKIEDSAVVLAFLTPVEETSMKFLAPGLTLPNPGVVEK